MKGKFFWLSIVAVAVSFAGGFLLANALNKNELNSLRAENDRLKNSQAGAEKNDSDSVLSDAEIRERISEADKNPTNLTYQKNLGIALYRYAGAKQDVELLTEAGRILNRVYENKPSDYAIVVTLGNIYFDIGYAKKDNAGFERRGQFYQNALEQKSNDADVRCDFALTYLLTDPPDNDKAISEFQKSLQANPKHEKTLQWLTQAYLKENKTADAEKYLARLKDVNPDNEAMSNLETQIAQTKNNLQKQ